MLSPALLRLKRTGALPRVRRDRFEDLPPEILRPLLPEVMATDDPRLAWKVTALYALYPWHSHERAVHPALLLKRLVSEGERRAILGMLTGLEVAQALFPYWGRIKRGNVDYDALYQELAAWPDEAVVAMWKGLWEVEE